MDNLDENYDKNRNSYNKIFLILQGVLIGIMLILILLIAVEYNMNFKHITYDETRVGNFNVELNSDIEWSKNDEGINYVSYVGSKNNTNVCIIRTYYVDSYANKDELVNKVVEFYSDLEDYSGISSLFTDEDNGCEYERFDCKYLDGQNAQIRVYDKNNYLSIIWLKNSELQNYVGNIEIMED